MEQRYEKILKNQIPLLLVFNNKLMLLINKKKILIMGKMRNFAVYVSLIVRNANILIHSKIVMTKTAY